MRSPPLEFGQIRRVAPAGSSAGGGGVRRCTSEEWDEEEDFLDRQLDLKGCRGVTHGYARSEVQRSRALVVGCNYPRSRSMRLWGACADARQWARTLSGRLGIPERNMAILVDETDDGKQVDESDCLFPSQRNLLEHLNWLSNNPQSGDLIVFIFCGRGTLLLEGSGLDDDSEVVEDNQGIEEALLCGDFDTADWARGYSWRMLTSKVAAQFWESLPRGVTLAMIIDAEHGVSMLPVTRRLDSARLPLNLSLEGEPTPVLEALTLGVNRSAADVKRVLRGELPAGMPVPAEPKRGARDSQGTWPQLRWLRGQALWDLGGGMEETGAMDAEVQAFALIASGLSGHAYEALVPESDRNGPFSSAAKSSSPSKSRRGPSKRRGVLTHCLLAALEEMNFQGSYYALWWRAVRIMRRRGFTDQNFQLTFSDGTDPTCREVFEPVGMAEARAYARREELDEDLLDDGEFTHRGQRCCAPGACDASLGLGLDAVGPLTARGGPTGNSWTCGTPASPDCTLM